MKDILYLSQHRHLTNMSFLQLTHTKKASQITQSYKQDLQTGGKINENKSQMT